MARTLASCRLALVDVLPTLRAAGLLLAEGNQDQLVQSPTTSGVLRTDSRKVTAGDVFLAYRGVASDGHDHLEKAIGLGAGFLVVEDAARVPKNATVPWAAVQSGRGAWAHLAAAAFGHPERRLTILGVTGTNGKSSTAWITGQLLAAMGIPSLVVGTLGAHLGKELIPTSHTTPDPDVLYALFALALDQGVRIVAMEVSSHAIHQEKVGPIRFDGCAFTSFSRDHLDLHGTMEEYWATKWRLFTDLAKPDARLIVNDGLVPTPRLGSLSGETVVYGLEANAKQKAWGARNAMTLRIEQSSFRGSKVAIAYGDRLLQGDIPYFAKHAVENFAASLLLAEKAAGSVTPPSLWPTLAPVRGRLEQVLTPSGGPFGPKAPGVLIDYAHTPDALEKTLTVVRPMTNGKLSVVFGCGGDRDRGKRPMMGAIAAALADRVYVTSDNPRSEDPDAIIRQISDGVDQSVRAQKLVIEGDRAKAIARAIEDAKAGDLVVIAGKGHETYQILKDRTIDFDDREVAAKCLGGRVDG